MKYLEACKDQSWHLHLWHPDDPVHTQVRVPYTCRSWRHPGPCQQWKGAQDFVRCKEAIQQKHAWVYVVLTFAQGDWPNPWDQYKAGVSLWAKLRKRISREYGTLKYIQTWERHKKGGAHVNLLLHCVSLQKAVEDDWRVFRRKWLEPHAVACGFGRRTWVEPMRGGGVEMAGYLTKLSRELVGAGSKNQVPYDAPPHFRRLRASVRTLPPIRKTDFTGRLRFCSLEGFITGTYLAAEQEASRRKAAANAAKVKEFVK